MQSLWISGTTRTGKTSRLVTEFCDWVRKQLINRGRSKSPEKLASAILVFAANNSNRRELNDRLSLAVEGTYPVICKTPVGFVTDEVMLFFPLLFEKLQLKAQFPLRLRPETEQELATRLWRDRADWEMLCAIEKEYRLVRQTLDLMQLAGASGIPTEDIGFILQEGFPESPIAGENMASLYPKMGEMLLQWREWCLERGLLSYGIIYELYWRYLLPNPQYKQHLIDRYQVVFADDLDDYPAIAKDLLALMLDKGTTGIFTYNPNGKVRLGLNADPDYLAELASRCKIETLPEIDLAIEADTAVELATESAYLVELPPSIQSLQTISRAELLRQTATIIIEAIEKEEIQPQDIAIIAPGLDEIARYTLIEILSASGIAIAPLNEQRPLISSPLVRSLLALLGLIYPDLGRLVDRDSIAEMLTILSQKPQEAGEARNLRKLTPHIDPVRAGSIADYCYHVGMGCSNSIGASPPPVTSESSYLAPVENFPRWDLLGHRATAAYLEITQWIEEIKILQEKQSFLTPTILLDRAIEKFFANGIYFTSDRLEVLRELMETAQHFWEIDRRLRQNEPSFQTQTATIAQFIQLLRRGTISANPRPTGKFPTQRNAITLATVFQYRSLRTSHKWQFWLDVGSPLWEKGGAATLFAAPLFLKKWSGRAWMPEDDYQLDKQRLERIIRDIIARAEQRIFLCHSDLSVNGTEQMGALLPLVRASRQI